MRKPKKFHGKVNETLMKKLMILTAVVVLAVLFVHTNATAAPQAKKDCNTIQSGNIVSSTGDVVTTGYDQWGYNYQAQMFNGWYENYTRPNPPVEGSTRLMMKWNNAWLSTTDCDGDNKLDRHFGYDSYIGSGAWLTNHQSGEYLDNGELCSYTYFVKIVAAPADANQSGGNWYTANGDLIGPSIWGQFIIIQENTNDSCGKSHMHAPLRSGLGNW